MTLAESTFKAILSDLIEENSFACRAALSLSEVTFTDSVPTACVSLERRPVLSVNLDFLNRHCQTEAHVKAVLIHEFLHVLLRHTLEIRRMNPVLNIALDAVINAMIHRKFGDAYSSFMDTYYSNARRLQKFLRPQRLGEHCAAEDIGTEEAAFWYQIYAGHAQPADVVEFIKARQLTHLEQRLKDGRPLLLGNHDENAILDSDDLPEYMASRLREAARQLSADDSLPGNPLGKPGDITVPPANNPVVAAWQRQTLAVLRRLVTPDARSIAKQAVPATVQLPIPSATDRRGLLHSLWNPILADMAWSVTREVPVGSALVYLDVSGSMSAELQPLVALLHRLGPIIRRPFFAFSNTVEPATIRNGRLITKSTGGTSLAPVIQHIRRTRPLKALVVTDGFVEQLSRSAYATPETEVEVLLSACGSDRQLLHSGWRVTRLSEP